MHRARVAMMVALALTVGGLLGEPAIGTARIHATTPSGELRAFTLVAEPVQWEIQQGVVVDGWGYNGSVPGPTIRVTEGDRVRVTLINRLPAPTTIHWHGIDVPVAQDGVPSLSQHPVEPGESFTYDFIATNPGTRWYHSHVDSNMQIQLGMYGAFIIDPRTAEPVRYDREYTYILSEKALDLTPAVAIGAADVRHRDAGNGRGGAFAPDLFLMNGKAGAAIDPVLVKEGERIRIRLINAGNLVHTMHTHGHSFTIVATDGNPVPPAARLVKDTVLIGPAERYDVEFVANNPGIWMFHCHINNHAANGMVTELHYDGAEPLAGGDHGPAHGVHAPARSPATSGPPATAPTPPVNPAVGGQAMQVAMVDDRFHPPRFTVTTGTIVTFINSGNNIHDPAALDGSWRAPLMARGDHFSHTFSAPGTYRFVCLLHLLQGMSGVITVAPP